MATRNKNKQLPKRLVISAAIAATFISGYGSRRAYAGSCSPTGAAGTYTCSGAANAGTDTTQNLNSGVNPLIVTTNAGFGIVSAGSLALNLSNLSGGTSIDFTDANLSSISSASTGILSINNGSGATNTTTTGLVTGLSGAGIGSINYSNATNITISSASVSGGIRGINATNLGKGATSITSSGTVTATATNGNGIDAENGSNATSLSISAAAVTGGQDGVRTRNNGTGATSITSTGVVTGATGRGIFGYNATTATNLTISTATVTGGTDGIYARNRGKGATSITTTGGTVTGTTARGIYAGNSSSATDLTISTAAVNGGSYGIRANNGGKGATSITSTGAVTGTTASGIFGYNGTSATNLTISTAAVTGQNDGIRARNNGKGASSITSTGAVTGTTDRGIIGYNNATATNLTISTAAVTGATDGVYARNRGKGATSITSTGAVTGMGTYGRGIYALNNASATNVTISAAAVTGQFNGIRAKNYGTGATSITSTGAVTGTSSVGVYAYNAATATNLTISTAAVTGRNGIVARNDGTGATSITVSGAVTGGAKGAGIYNRTVNASTITLNSGASVSATSGNAIIGLGGNTNLIINSGASVTGTISLGKGDDEIRLAGGDFSGITQISVDGDVDVAGTAGTNDKLTFAGSTGVFDQTRLQGIDIVTIDSGSTMGLTFVDNRFNASALNNSALIVQNGGILNASNGFSLIGNLINSSGIVSMQNNSIDTPASISGNYTGGGQLLLDANFATNTADKLNITGNVLAGGTRVGVRDISTGPATGAAITLVSVGGTTTTGDFVLAAPVVNGAFNYNTLALIGKDWVLQSVGSTPATPATPAFTPIAASFETFSQSLITLEGLSSFYQRTQERIGGSSNSSGANSGDMLGIDSPVWLRVARGYREIDSNSSSTGANFDTNHWKGQVGIDFPVAQGPNGQFIVGINAGYGQADTKIKSIAGQSSIDTDNYSIGLSGTWIAKNGLYVDTQLQRSWYQSDLSAGGVGAGIINDVDGDGYAASIEIGKEITLNESFTIIPQAQLAYAKINTDDFTGANAELVRAAEGKSLRARLGALLSKRFTEDGSTQGFIIANVIREFEDATSVNVSGTQLTNAVDKYNGELGLGVQHAWSKGTTQYQFNASVTGSTSLNNFGDSNAVQGQVGFKANF